MDSNSRGHAIDGKCRRPRGAGRPRRTAWRLLRTVAAASSFVGVFTIATLYRIETRWSQPVRANHWALPLYSPRGQNVTPSATSLTTIEVQNEEGTMNLTGRQTARQRRLAEVCAEHASLRQNDRPWQYKVDHRRRILYCPIPKAGWSSWKRVFFYLSGLIPSVEAEVGITSDQKAGIYDVSAAGARYLQSEMMAAQHFFTFVFVRNPWERLVSAYINKAIDWNYTRIMHQPCSWENEIPYKESISFLQFLKCIAESEAHSTGMDMHWTPMWRLCDFCQLHYDYIGHMETVAEDAKYIIEKKDLKVVFPRAFYSKAFRTRDVLKEWYKAVPCSVIESLRKLYAFDFLLHGYSDIPPGWSDAACSTVL